MAAEVPKRAVRLTLRIDADTCDDLVTALLNFADRVARREITTGVWGSPSDGGIYELHDAGHPTHDEYFASLREYLGQAAHEKGADHGR